MKKWGLSLLLFGAISLVLPLIGFQFRILSGLGDTQSIVSVLLMVVGLVLFVVGLAVGSKGTADTPDASAPAEGTAEQWPGSAPAEQPVPDTGAACPGCGQMTAASDAFCGYCGTSINRVQPSVQQTTPAQPVAVASTSHRSIYVVVGIIVLLVVGVVSVGVYRVIRVVGPKLAMSDLEQAPDGEASSEQADSVSVPNKADLAALAKLRDEEEGRLQAARAAGDRDRAARLAQRHQHYKDAVRLAGKMTEAHLEMLAAKEAGDSATAAAKAHSYRHHRGQLSFLAGVADQPLARIIQNWTGRSPPDNRLQEDDRTVDTSERGETNKGQADAAAARIEGGDEFESLLAGVVEQAAGQFRVDEGAQATSSSEVQELIQRLGHSETLERIEAAMELAMCGQAATPAIPALVEMLKDSASEVRMAAAIALGGIGAESEVRAAAPALVEALQDPSAIVRTEAAIALGQIGLFGSEAAPAVKALRKALQDEDQLVRDAAEEALDLMGE